MFFRTIFLLFGTCALIFSAASFALAQTEDDAQQAAVAEFERGQNAHEKGDVAGALKSYEKAIALQPEFPEAEYQRGTALEQLKRDQEAEKAFRRAFEIRSDWSLPMAKLGALLVKRNDFGHAEEVLNKAIALDAANSLALSSLAELEINSRAGREKLQVLLGKIKNNTDGKANAPIALWVARAALEQNLGLSDAAKTSVLRALQIEPNNVSARLTHGEILLSENDFASALDDAKFVLRLAPENLLAQLLLARIYAATGKSEESLKIIAALSEEKKKLPVVIELRNAISINSISNSESSSNNSGIDKLEKLLETDTKNVVLLGKLCNLTRTVNPSKALGYCRRAAELEPSNIAYAVGYGAALVQAREFENAIAILRRILTVSPDNYTARANLATALYEAKHLPAAIAEFNALIDAKPDVSASYFFLATAHDALGNFTEAMAAYQKFLTLADPHQNQLEIDKVKLRLPGLSRQIEKGAGRKKSRG